MFDGLLGWHFGGAPADMVVFEQDEEEESEWVAGEDVSEELPDDVRGQEEEVSQESPKKRGWFW